MSCYHDGHVTYGMLHCVVVVVMLCCANSVNGYYFYSSAIYLMLVQYFIDRVLTLVRVLVLESHSLHSLHSYHFD